MQENQMQTCKNGIGRWTKENINLVCILHPTNPQDYSYETKDKNEKLTCQCWKIRSEKNLKNVQQWKKRKSMVKRELLIQQFYAASKTIINFG